jgi:hypothetical protein
MEMWHTAIREKTSTMTSKEGDPVRLAGSCLIQSGLKFGGSGNNIAQDVQYKLRGQERRPPLLTNSEYSNSLVTNNGQLQLLTIDTISTILSTPITTLSSRALSITSTPLQPLHHSTTSSFSERKRPPATIETTLRLFTTLLYYRIRETHDDSHVITSLMMPTQRNH